MTLFADMSECVKRDESLAALTSFRLGGLARWLASPADVNQVSILLDRCCQEAIPFYPLGRGANLLVGDDGVDGLVLHLNTPSFQQVDWADTSDGGKYAKDRQVVISVRGGVDMHQLVLNSVRRGLAGLEVLAGIPGTLGGCIRMNAGGRWGAIADVVCDVTVVNRNGGIVTLTADQVGFAYRTSGLADAVVCEARLKLTPADPVRLRQRMMDIWQAKKATQPLGERSAGCVFKNPIGASAGALVDQAGLKGMSVGGARVSELHGNFIVAREGATAQDVFTLIDQVQTEVVRQSGVELELEIEVWGRHGSRIRQSVA